MTSTAYMTLGALALREEIGEAPEPPGDLRLRYVYCLTASRWVLDDPPALAGVLDMTLGQFLQATGRDPSAPHFPMDVVGPLTLDAARARELYERYVARDFFAPTFDDEWPSNIVVVAVGGFTDRIPVVPA